ncbi:MAG: YceI family protein [Candidatus Omnitrophica bacterium]|nr:YceI family protein [Candidatus Omnitrophota bacterium]
MTRSSANIRTQQPVERPAVKGSTTSFDPSNAKCHIFTFKDGLLALFAHDLKLQATKFQINITGCTDGTSLWRKVDAAFDPASIRTVCAVDDNGKPAGDLSPNHGKDIEKNIFWNVLRPRKFPTIRFTSKKITGKPDNFLVHGDLSLCEATRAVTIPVKLWKRKYCAEISLDQLDFGITPFCALMGAMKVKPEVTIRVEMNAGAIGQRKIVSRM